MMIQNTVKILEEKNFKNARQLVLYDTPVASLQFFVLNIIYDEERIKPWFYCNYIQLEWLDDWCITFSILQDYYVGYPYIDKQILIRDTIDNSGIDIVDFLISNINQGWYTHLCFDEYYIPNKESYQKEHIPHDNMICGYDLEKQIFTLFGYADSAKLEVTYAGFDEVRKGYQELAKIIYPDAIGSMQYYNLIFMIKKNMDLIYRIDVDYLEKSLEDYLYGRTYAEHFRMIKNIVSNKIYGLNIYEKLLHAFQEKEEKIIEDIRLLTTLYEHKNIMASRIDYLMETGIIRYDADLLREFEDIKRKTAEIRSIQLYYILGRNQNILQKISQNLYDLRQKEESAIEQLIGCLKRRSQ